MRSALTCRKGLSFNAECRMQMVAVLFPHFGHAAIEERFASWQARTRFREGGAEVVPYAPDDLASDVAVVPVTNLPANPVQQHHVDLYLTLRELEIINTELESRQGSAQRVPWD